MSDIPTGVAPMTEYVVRVRPTADHVYRATIREVAPGVCLDVRTLPTGAAGVGAASTVNAAILSAFIAAHIPAIPSRQARNGRETARTAPRTGESMRAAHRVRHMKGVV